MVLFTDFLKWQITEKSANLQENHLILQEKTVILRNISGTLDA